MAASLCTGATQQYHVHCLFAYVDIVRTITEKAELVTTIFEQLFLAKKKRNDVYKPRFYNTSVLPFVTLLDYLNTPMIAVGVV